MSQLQINCPKCGKPVAFQGDFAISSICEACGAIVVRPDAFSAEQPSEARVPDTLPLPQESNSPLEFGMRGRWQGHDFQLRGVVRLQHDAGGFWDEWYLLFDDGRCGWLAEVQQQFFLTFPIELKSADKIPEFRELRIEQPFRLRGGAPLMKVAEKGVGRPIGARGQIPYDLKPQADYRYADLSGPGGRFATIDYGDSPPSVYLGLEVHLADLHLPHRHEDVSHEPVDAELAVADCPHCHHRLTLFVPRKTVRVGCTACGYLLDASDGRLQVAHESSAAPKPRLPIGTKGRLNGIAYTVIGYLKRALASDSSETWDEYLLYNADIGFRWLTCSDDEWNFVEAIAPGEEEDDGGRAIYAGKMFRWEEQDVAVVSCVLGEFYWKIDRGERVAVTDFVRPAEILSREINFDGPDAGEVSWSHGSYVSADAIQRAFGLTHPLPRPTIAAPNEPSSHTSLFVWWAVMVALTLMTGFFFMLRGRSDQVARMECDLPAASSSATPGTGGDFSAPNLDLSTTAATTPSGGTGSLATSGSGSSGDEGQIFFSQPFAVRNRENVEIQISASNTNFWLGVDGDLVDEQSGVVQEFSTQVEYYQGVSDGEAWTEGSRQATVYVSSLPAGRYLLRLVGQQEPRAMPIHFTVRVRENVPRIAHLLLALAGVSLLPAIVLAARLYRRAKAQ